MIPGFPVDVVKKMMSLSPFFLLPQLAKLDPKAIPTVILRRPRFGCLDHLVDGMEEDSIFFLRHDRLFPPVCRVLFGGYWRIWPKGNIWTF